MKRQTITRRQVLTRAVGASAFAAAPAFLRHATAATPIKIGIPTVITGGYALLGSQVMRTCKLVKKMTDAKGGVLGQPVEFFYQDTQGDPATCVRKCQELVERDNCHILTGVIVSSEAAAMLPKLEEWNAIFISHGNGDGRLTAELFVPRFFRANTSAPMGARALALYLKDAPEKKFIAHCLRCRLGPLEQRGLRGPDQEGWQGAGRQDLCPGRATRIIRPTSPRSCNPAPRLLRRAARRRGARLLFPGHPIWACAARSVLHRDRRAGGHQGARQGRDRAHGIVALSAHL